MASNGGNKPSKDKYKEYKKEVFEFEDFGTPTMYLAAIGTVLFMLGLVILFAMVVASGAVAISEVIK